ncbi:T9SS type A sorting domain-containing protein [Hymenobacter sp.]|uniref:T9SS type A sorting domain-containing protein n=1 Tax=Hymenobacter sp. TaxID=1898978 RepID=UPI00286C7514|nr:T9SS type A sorting domain-containing protein [Hymenobacter sp.]
MKKSLLTILILMGLVLRGAAQAVLYNGPEAVFPNSTENYATVKLPPGVSVSWSIAGTGATIQGLNTNPLVFFDAATAPVTLTATLSNQTSFTATIPAIPQGPTLIEGTVPMVSGARQHPINQLLRGQRVKVKPINFTGAAPQLTLLSSQGRVLAQGDSIDFRSPTRGVYFVLVRAQSAGQLQVEGVSPYTPPTGGANASSPLTPPAAAVGSLDFQLDSRTNFTGGEAALTVGNQVITAVYDFVLNKTIVSAYQNDQLQWSWLSNDHEYIRTLTGDATHGIAGIGSAGGALKSQDNVVVVKLSPTGALQTRTTFGTANGRDYGYGVSFLNDGSLMATGFTEGSFPGFTNAGELDAFAVHVSTTGSVLNTLQYGTPENDRVFASRTLLNGNVLLFGDTEGQIGDTGAPRGSFDIFLTELTPAGVRVRNTQYGSNENDLAFDLVVDPASGDVFITGQTTSALAPGIGNPQRPQVYTARISHTTQALVWVRQLGPNEGQSGESLALSPTGVGVIFYTFGSFSGASNNSLGTPASDDMVVVLYDFNGNLTTLYQFDQTLERVFARAIAFQGTDVFVLRDHVYEPGRPYITTSLDRFANPSTPLSSRNPAQAPQALAVFPNPARSFVQVTADQGYQLLNSVGAVVKADSRPTDRISLDGLSPGFYLIRTGNKTGRFVKE